MKSLLWIKGGFRITIAGNNQIARELATIYSSEGKRSFDNELIGRKVYGCDLEVVSRLLEDAPVATECRIALGRNFNGLRIGFDLGGSDRKCAAVVDGEGLFSAMTCRNMAMPDNGSGASASWARAFAASGGKGPQDLRVE